MMSFIRIRKAFREECVKKSKKIVLALTGLLSAITATHSFAYPSLPFGWYIDGDIGFTTFNGKTYPGATSMKSSGKAWSGDIGYKFSKFLAIESGYTRYMTTRI